MASFKAKFPVLQELFAKNHRGGPLGPPAGRGLFDSDSLTRIGLFDINDDDVRHIFTDVHIFSIQLKSFFTFWSEPSRDTKCSFLPFGDRHVTAPIICSC